MLLQHAIVITHLNLKQNHRKKRTCLIFKDKRSLTLISFIKEVWLDVARTLPGQLSKEADFKIKIIYIRKCISLKWATKRLTSC